MFSVNSQPQGTEMLLRNKVAQGVFDVPTSLPKVLPSARPTFHASVDPRVSERYHTSHAISVALFPVLILGSSLCPNRGKLEVLSGSKNDLRCPDRQASRYPPLREFRLGDCFASAHCFETLTACFVNGNTGCARTRRLHPISNRTGSTRHEPFFSRVLHGTPARAELRTVLQHRGFARLCQIQSAPR